MSDWLHASKKAYVIACGVQRKAQAKTLDADDMLALATTVCQLAHLCKLLSAYVQIKEKHKFRAKEELNEQGALPQHYAKGLENAIREAFEGIPDEPEEMSPNP